MFCTGFANIHQLGSFVPDKFLKQIDDPTTIITAIDVAVRFPEILEACRIKYSGDIATFKNLVAHARSSDDLLDSIRSRTHSAERRMALLKIFRRAVSPVIDTEMAKKIKKVSTVSLISAFGHTFKPITVLKSQFSNLTADQEAALAALIGEYDTRGQLGYLLTSEFFQWFESHFRDVFTIEGPRGAGRDIELSTLFAAFEGNYPCDFIVRSACDNVLRAIGFARYDSTRGGAQSDDRTGGNSDKVSKAREFSKLSGEKFRIIFLADGPGLGHRDTWAEAVRLDGSYDGNVRVCTLKTAGQRITADWLLGNCQEF